MSTFLVTPKKYWWKFIMAENELLALIKNSQIKLVKDQLKKLVLTREESFIFRSLGLRSASAYK
jgi:hypothetical protein